MPSITYDGETVEFEDFSGMDFARRVNLVREPDFLNGEGIWAQIRPEDQGKYEDDTSFGDLIVCSLRNHAIGGTPWGAYIVAKTNGANRPTSYIPYHEGEFTLCPEALAGAEARENGGPVADLAEA